MFVKLDDNASINVTFITCKATQQWYIVIMVYNYNGI